MSPPRTEENLKSMSTLKSSNSSVRLLGRGDSGKLQSSPVKDESQLKQVKMGRYGIMLKSYGNRSFQYAAVQLWNSLPDVVKQADET